MYIQMISIHGLVRGDNVEMGRDADTGGQIRYVLELARTLSRLPDVTAVDLFTRRIRDKRVSASYGEELEELESNCRIVRLPCGGGKYVRKEKLWPVLDEYIDAMIAFNRRQDRLPDAIHGHYADAGYIAQRVAAAFDIPFIFTGHSLGKPKLEYLQSEGMSREKADQLYNIEHRIRVEQECLDAADCVITSTRHERDQQYRQYQQSPELRFEVIPPGTDLERFFPHYDYDLHASEIDERFKQARVRMLDELGRFHINSDKPMILALCRPDRRKNISALIDVYGNSNELQAIANLAVFAGIRKDIKDMPEAEQSVLTEMLLAMDRYDLYGKMAIPKNHDSEFDVPELYRLAASSRGIFVNTAFTELFGLTAIESSAVGLPFVVTNNGGPRDIVENCESGLIVDVNDPEELKQAMLQLLTDRQAWDQASANGINRVRKHYSWESHCRRYWEVLKKLPATPRQSKSRAGKAAPGRRFASLDRILITDIDNTLIGDEAALQRLLSVVADNRDRLGFGVASGRAPELIEDVLEQYGIADLDVMIASVGSEIYYGGERTADEGWSGQLQAKWRPDQIRETLDAVSGLMLQPAEHTQRRFKISYLIDEHAAGELIPQIHERLASRNIAYSLIHSHGSFIDILPHRASKGKAIRYLSDKWNIPLHHIATAGDSGNDRDMLTGRTSGIVVGNHADELASLRRSKSTSVYFADRTFADGILEGLRHYGFVTADNDDESSHEEESQPPTMIAT